jgi:phosphatidylserine/phosphatidylglycerophosphate/cardiolipin synthase-like enzyme
MVTSAKSRKTRRLRTPLLLSLCLLNLFFSFSSVATELTLGDTPAQVCFSPNKGCTEAIVRELDGAKSEILVQAYSFTSTAIAEALLAAHKRGVQVSAILDKSQRGARHTSATFLADAGITTYVDSSHAIAHNKIIIIDRSTLITGSFNFTKAAEERNAENLLILRSPQLAEIYVENWSSHMQHSEAFRRQYSEANST